MASADACLVLHPDRAVLDHGQPRLTAGLAGIGLPLHVHTPRSNHPLESAQPGLDFVGCHRRQSRGGTHQAGRGPRGRQRLGDTTLITPAQANLPEHLAELGRVMRGGQHWPQAALLPTRNPTRRGWANDDRPGVCHATCGRVDRLPWVQRRAWARRRHPTTAARGVANRSGHRHASCQGCATPPTRPRPTSLASHRATARLRHAHIADHRRPDDGDWGSWSPRRGPSPTVRPRRAPLITHQGGRCTSCPRCFHHADQRESDPRNGPRRDARSGKLHACHGHGHDAKPREQGAHLPGGIRDKVSAH